jgi:hypothetical protein
MAAAAGLGVGGTDAWGVTLTSYYNNAVISTVLPAHEVIGVNATLVSLDQASPMIPVPLGDYVSYGVSSVVTNNVNPNGGSLYGDGVGGVNNIVDPTNLGVANVGFKVIDIASNNSLGRILQPVLGAILGTAGTLVQYQSTAVVGGIGKAGLSTPKSGYNF